MSATNTARAESEQLVEVPHPAAPRTVRFRFCGHAFEPLASGALFWPAERALLVADMHLEKMSSFAPRGMLLPPYDTGKTLSRLEADLAFTRAERVISLGDSFHRDEGTATLLPRDRARLAELLARYDWVWIAGNHDPGHHELGGTCVNGLELGGLNLIHEPERGKSDESGKGGKGGKSGEIAGHLHPAARVRINGRSTRRPCFVADQRLMMLPAYGASTGALDLSHRAFSGLFDRSRLQVFMLGRACVYQVAVRHLVLD